MIRLAVDYEFSSREWWESGGQELWDAITEDFDGSYAVVEDGLAESWLQQAQAIPGWNDGPSYAPHPIHQSTLEDDQVDLL